VNFQTYDLGISPLQVLPVPAQCSKTQKSATNIHASSKIQTRDPSIRTP